MHRRPRLKFLWLATLLCAVAGSFAADKKPLVAISPLEAKKVDAEEVDLITEALAGELQNSGAFRVMERGQMDRILKEQGFQASGACEGNECAVEVGKMLGIDRIVVGSVGKIGSLFIINTRLVDIATGEILASVRRTKDGELKDVLTDLVPQVARGLASEKTDEQAVPVVAATPPPPKPAAPVAAAPSSGGSALPWLVAGAAVVGGGVAAYFLLQDDKSSSTGTAPDDNGGSNSGSTVTIPVTW